MSRLLVPFYVILISAGTSVDCDFSYEGNEELTPENWSAEYKQCDGKLQSPIDIDEKAVTRVSLPPLKFNGAWDLPWSATLKNNGHTVELRLNSTLPVLLSGGPLDDVYKFEQLHFHWGKNNSVGSEGQINHKSYSMELHQVYFKRNYGTFQEALKHKDGLLVLAVFFRVLPAQNRAYQYLVEGVKRIKNMSESTTLPYLVPLKHLLPNNRIQYFVYNGSLTTPPCSEVVTWIDFKKPVGISEEQLQQFHGIYGAHGPLTFNIRPIQATNGRPVLFNVENQAVERARPKLPKSNTYENLGFEPLDIESITSITSESTS